MKRIALPVAFAGALLLGGCVSDRAIFVTNTSLGLDLDTAPATASIAYDRTEGVLAPSYENGGIGPILGTVETDGAIIAPKVRQLYGTGDAAVISATGVTPLPATPKPLTGTHHTAFIGTSTTLGVKVTFSADTVISSFNFGYKRKEFTNIRLGSQGGQAFYPSVLASLDTTIQTPNPTGVTLTTRQFISTGAAADALASTEAGQFLKKAATAAAVAATPEGAAALAKSITDQETEDQKTVSAYVTHGGSWEKSRLATLVDKVPGLKPPNATALKSAASLDDLKTQVNANTTLWSALAAAAK